METPRLSRTDKVLLTSLPLTVDQPMQHSPNSAKLLRVAELNPHLTCPLCGGYYVDATSITECLHSFCRSCIVSHLSKSLFCPVCSEKVHETKPLLMIREDKTLQDLVYKLVPGLLAKEIKRRRDFYNERNADDAEKDCLLSGANARNSEAARLSVQIKEKGEGADWQRYLYCPASMSVGHLMAWLRGKLKICRRRFELRVVHRSRDCRPQQTLADLRDMVPSKDDSERRLLLEFEKRKAVGPNKTGPCYHCGATVSQEFGVYVNTGTIVAKGTIRRASENVEKNGEGISAPIAKKMKTIDEKVKDSDSGIDAGSGSPSENNSGEKENKGVTGSENIQTPAGRPNGQILKSPPNSAKKPSVLLAQLTKPALRPPPQTLFPSTPSTINKNIPRPSTPKRAQNKTPRAPTPKRVKKEESKASSNLSKPEEKTNQTKTVTEQRKSPIAASMAASKPIRGLNEVVERLHSKNSKGTTTNGTSPGSNNGLNGTPSAGLPPPDKDHPTTGGAVMVVNDPPTVTTLRPVCCRSDETGRCKGHPVTPDSKTSNTTQYGNHFPLDLSKARFPIPLNVPVPRPSIMPH